MGKGCTKTLLPHLDLDFLPHLDCQNVVASFKLKFFKNIAQILFPHFGIMTYYDSYCLILIGIMTVL